MMTIEISIANGKAVVVAQINANMICYAPQVRAEDIFTFALPSLAWRWHELVIIRTKMGIEGVLNHNRYNLPPQELNDLRDAFNKVYQFNNRGRYNGNSVNR